MADESDGEEKKKKKKSPGDFVKKKSVERYKERFGDVATKARFGSSNYTTGMRRGNTPSGISSKKEKVKDWGKGLYDKMPPVKKDSTSPLKIINLVLKIISFIFLWPIALAPMTLFSTLGKGFPNFVGYILIGIGILMYIFFFDFLALFMKKNEEGNYGGIDIFNIIMTLITLLFFSFIYNLFGDWKVAAWFSLVFVSTIQFYKSADKKHKPKIIKVAVIILVLLLVSFLFKIAFIDTGRLDNVILPLQQKLGFGGGDDSRSSFEKFWDMLFNPHLQKDFGSFEDQELKKKDIGIVIRDFKPTMSTFYENHPISVRGTIEAASLYSEDSGVKFNCEMEDYSGELEVTPNEATLSGNAIKMIKTVACVFVKGVDANKKIDTKSVKLVSSFDNFYTESTYPVYYLNREKYDELNIEGKNPFDVYGWDKSFLGGKNVMNSKVSPGPIDIIIGSQIPQPFIAGEENLFIEVLIKEDNQVELNKIKDFKLFVPNDIDLSSEDNFCSFKLGESDNMNYNIYTLKDLNINPDLDTYNYNCFFSIGELNYGEYRGDYFKVEMDYSFDITKRTVVSIAQTSED